ncbi:hypothetical protein CI610_00206 [invertebrate metagenome]|uniref:Uncharacterized protein n=1 Tax=invertebrate metagenome TaxID=1711999 RepID=A0A2H9TC08_9ZZZZ
MIPGHFMPLLMSFPIRKNNISWKECLLVAILSLMALVLSGCSWFGEGRTDQQQGAASIGHWQTTQRWAFHGMPEKLAAMTQQKVTLSARCYFRPEVLRLKVFRQGIMLPVLGVSESLSMAPHLEHTSEMFNLLQEYWKLGNPMENFFFYQRLLSSVEHACPPNLNRDIPSCAYLKWLPFVGQGSHGSLYDESRMERWLKEHPDVSYIIYQPAEIYQSETLFNLGYSLHKEAITRQPAEKRWKAVEPWLGKFRIDWYTLSKPGKMPALTPVNRVGFCEMVWEELEEKKAEFSRHLTVSQMQQIHQVLWPEFCQVVSDFMEELTVAESDSVK